MHSLLALLVVALAVPLAHADSWGPPGVQTRATRNGLYVIRVVPGDTTFSGNAGAAKASPAAAEWHRFNGARYEKVNTVQLPNRVAPVDIAVTEAGFLAAFDNWHSLGHGNAVVIYAPSGKVVKVYTLNDLFSKDDRARLTVSTSSIHWRCRAYAPANANEIVVDDQIGGRFVFVADSGEFRYQRDGGDC
jgi:hypothetical protein